MYIHIPSASLDILSDTVHGLLLRVESRPVEDRTQHIWNLMACPKGTGTVLVNSKSSEIYARYIRCSILLCNTNILYILKQDILDALYFYVIRIYYIY